MTDNQDSVTIDAVQPPTDRPLTAGDVLPMMALAMDKLMQAFPDDCIPSASVCVEVASAVNAAKEVLERPAASAASEDGWSPVNVNDTVQVRLTDLGRETHKAYWEPFSAGNYRPVKVDGDGWSEFQLWDLMAVFGPKIRMGMDVPFETTIRVKTPALASPPVSERERELEAKVAELEAKLNTPEVEDFARAIVSEAQHQRDRWGSDHDAEKTALDWFWLVGYLSQKVVVAASKGDDFKAKHHTISTAAALANWHAALSGDHTAMRPGIDTPAFDLTAQPAGEGK